MNPATEKKTVLTPFSLFEPHPQWPKFLFDEDVEEDSTTSKPLAVTPLKRPRYDVLVSAKKELEKENKNDTNTEVSPPKRLRSAKKTDKMEESVDKKEKSVDKKVEHKKKKPAVKNDAVHGTSKVKPREWEQALEEAVVGFDFDGAINILDSCDVAGNLVYLVRSKGSGKTAVVPAPITEEKWSQAVIAFYKSRVALKK